MKKFVMLVFFLLSLATIIAISFSINELFSGLGLGSFDLEDILSLFEGATFEDIVPVLGMFLWGVFQY